LKDQAMGYSGGCLCGGVRYELKSEPFDCGWCHCRTCQLFGGAPAMPFASAAASDFVWAAGDQLVRTVQSSNFGRRSFCGRCGTPLLVQVDHQPDTVDFPVVTLDEPDVAAPEFHIFWSRKVTWFNPGDTVPRHAKFRPGTRGLENTDPPDNSSLAGKPAD
jgi:hypothetical protein